MPSPTNAGAPLRRMIAGVVRIVELSRVFETNYPTIRSTFVDALTETSLSYLSGNRKDVTLHSAQRATALAYMQAANAGFRVNAPAGERMEADDAEFVAAETDDELGFVESLWDDLAEVRARRKPDEDISAPHARIQIFANSLDALYSEMALRGAKYLMLTFDGDDGKESCATCRRLKGQRHRSKWWLEKGLVPGVPGNENFICQGYNCEHYLRDDDGNRVTL